MESNTSSRAAGPPVPPVPAVPAASDPDAVTTSRALEDLASAVDALLAEPVVDIVDSGRETEVVVLRGLIDRLEAGYAARVAVLHQRGVALADGAVSTQAWLHRHARVGRRDAHRHVRTSTTLAELPVVLDAWTAGQLTAAHARSIARAADRYGFAVVSGCQDQLVAAAQAVDGDTLHRVIREAARLAGVAISAPGDAVGPDETTIAASSAARARYSLRQLHLSTTSDGMTRVDGLLDPDSGAVVSTAIAALAAPWLAGDMEVGHDAVAGQVRDRALAAGAGRPRDPRSAAQRRADALAELCRRVLDSGALPDSAGEKPHVTITVPLPWLEQRAGSRLRDVAQTSRSGSPVDEAASAPEHTAGVADALLPAGRDSAPPPDHRLGAVAQQPTLADPRTAGPMAAAVHRLLCDAQIHRLVLDGDSQPLDVGRATRTVTPAQRRALRARDNGCRFPRCDRPHSWTDAHHVVFWRHGGCTDLDNLISLCARHHHAVHEHGWALRVERDDEQPALPRFVFTDPDGQQHAARDPRAEPRLAARLAQALVAARPGLTDRRGDLGSAQGDAA